MDQRPTLTRPRRREARSAHPVVVCGAGAAGLGAAIAAARAGREVFLIESDDRVGGTVAHVLIHTLGGLYDADGRLLNDGLPEELAATLARADRDVRPRRLGRTWVLNVCPTTYQAAVEAWLQAEARIVVLTGSRVVEAGMAGDRVESLRLVRRDGTETCELRPSAVVDATGTGALARLVRPNLVEDRPRPAAGGLVWRLGRVAPRALAAPKGVSLVRALHGAAREGRLPAACERTWLDSGVRDDEVYVKHAVAVGASYLHEAEIRRHAERASAELTTVVDFLRRQSPDFAGAEVTATGRLGVRDGGSIRGETVLTADDVRTGRRFADVACRCAWPIEFWDPERGVSLEYPANGGTYDVPLGALKAAGVANLWMAGKCLSADALAQASVRVAGTCWAMGGAVGRAAARA